MYAIRSYYADVVEVSPPFDPSGVTALTGATMMFELLCVSALALQRRRDAADRNNFV